MKIKTIQFPNGNQARAVCVSRDTNAEEIISALDLPRPRALLILNGGTAEIETELQVQLSRLMQDGIARFAAEEGITLITGGTDAGIFALLGQGLARWGQTVPCIGIAVADLVTWPGRIPRWLPRWWLDRGRASLEPHHSHFVLVKGKKWGDETATMYRLAETLAQDCPSLAIFAGGGEIAKREMRANVEQGRKMILLAGSGRATDAVFAALNGEQVDDAGLAEVAQRGKIVSFPVEQDPSALSDLVRRLLFNEMGDR